MKIAENLEIAKPRFLYYIKNMNTGLTAWIQYKGVELDKNEMFFIFKSSQNSLNFRVYAGLNTNNIYYILKGKTTEIYLYFRDLKLNN